LQSPCKVGTEMAVQLVSVQCTNDGPRRDLEL